MSYPSYGEQRLPSLPASRILQTDPTESSELFGTQPALGQGTFDYTMPPSPPQGPEFMTTSQVPIATQLLRSGSGQNVSPPLTAVPFGTQPLPVPGGMSPAGSMNLGGQSLPVRTLHSPIGSSRQVEGPQIAGGQWSQAQGGHLQAQLRSLPGERVMQMQDDNMPRGDSARWEAAAPESQPRVPVPTMFTTAAVPQIEAQDADSRLGLVGTEEENEYLQARVEELEQSHISLQQQLYVAQTQTLQAPGLPSEHIAMYEQRIQEAEESEANALQAHEIRVGQINDLEQEIFRMRAEMGAQGGNGPQPEDSQHMLELQQHLEIAKSAEVQYKGHMEQQEARIEEHAREITRSRNAEAQLNYQIQQQQSQTLDLERRHAEAQREKETHKRIADDHATALQQSQVHHSNAKQELDQRSNQLKSLEDAYQNQVMEERRRANELQDVLESETRAKEFHQQQSASNQDQIRDLQNEVTYLKSVETFHKGQGERHRKEAQRLKRLRDEDAPMSPPIRMPLKALEERIMHLACFMMMGVCALPIMGAIAVLTDENYRFWLGQMWPWLVIAGCSFVFLLFAITMQVLLNYALPEHRSQFTMAFTWATFAALLGIILVPLSLMANKEALNIASTISQGCLTAMPQSEMLVDYSQVLYNIRLSQNCTGAMSVKECQGWSANEYTNYLEYLESDFHCGPLCPESPPPARMVQAPGLHNTPVPTLKPTLEPPPMIGPPLQGALGHGTGNGILQSSAFLQAIHEHQAIREHHVPAMAGSGVMETALPHMQAQKLFNKGTTRMTCYPLIATRLQVLVTTFGGLWYWEGMGLIIISLLTSIYAGLYFALHGTLGM